MKTVIDWSQAPVSYDYHLSYDKNPNNEGFCRIGDNGSYYFSNGDSAVNPDDWTITKKPYTKPVAPTVAVYTKKMADDGVMPSAGMECLMSLGEEIWFKYRVDYMGKAHTVGFWFDKSREVSFGLHRVIFKPLTPPIKLIDGKAYQFDVRDKGGIVCGIYHEYDKRLHVGQDHYFDLMSATNIQLLTEEVKPIDTRTDKEKACDEIWKELDELGKEYDLRTAMELAYDRWSTKPLTIEVKS